MVSEHKCNEAHNSLSRIQIIIYNMIAEKLVCKSKLCICTD